MFQHDSGLLREGIEEFLQWDYVGAPWKESAFWAHPKRKGGNGGLSLRNPKKALDLCQIRPNGPNIGKEDVYFTKYLELVKGNVAPYEVCRKFSCETVFELGTLGYHNISTHLSMDQCEKIMHQYDKLSK